jgi:hypothetical protein
VGENSTNGLDLIEGAEILEQVGGGENYDAQISFDSFNLELFEVVAHEECGAGGDSSGDNMTVI